MRPPAGSDVLVENGVRADPPAEVGERLCADAMGAFRVPAPGVLAGVRPAATGARVGGRTDALPGAVAIDRVPGSSAACTPRPDASLEAAGASGAPASRFGGAGDTAMAGEVWDTVGRACSAELFQRGVTAPGVGLAATRNAERAIAIVRSIAPGR